MKTALITGGAGFIAHHLIARILTQTDWNIVTLDSATLDREQFLFLAHYYT